MGVNGGHLMKRYSQAVRDYIKGYVYERGLKIRFATTWLEKP
jgi:hypothetical protein